MPKEVQQEKEKTAADQLNDSAENEADDEWDDKGRSECNFEGFPLPYDWAMI